MVAVTGRARCLMDTGRFPPGGFRPSVNPAEPEALYPHIIREIRARIEPALDDGRFARKKRCYARANNAGWRIDYFLVSERIRGCIEESSILPEVMGSDHCPVMLEMGMPE